MIKQKKHQQIPFIQQQQRYRSKMQIFKMTASIALASIYFGYIQVYLGAIKIETIVQAYHIEFDQSLAQGILNGCIPFGAIFGSLSIQFLLSKISRRKSLLLVNLVAFVVGVLIYIPNVYSLIFFRLIQGICTGIYSGLPSLMIKQLSPVQISGTMGTFTQLNLTLGIILGYLLTYILKKITGDMTGQAFWFIVFGFPLITIAIQSFILVYVIPYETPKYLLLNNRRQQAQQLIRIIYKDQYVQQVVQEKLQDLRKIQQNTIEQNQSIISQHQNQTSNKNKRLAIIISLHVAIFQQLSGVSVLNVYCGPIVEKIASGQLKLLVPTLLISTKLMGTVVTSNLISCLGRKTILQIGLLLLAIGNTSISLGFFLKEQQQSTISQVLIISGMFFFLAIFGFTAGPIVWIYLSQIVQPKSFSNAVAILWLFSALMVILFPVIDQNVLDGDPCILFLLFGCWCLVSFVINYFFMVETKDKTQKQIQQDYQNLKIC